MDRRDFLKILGISTGAAAVSSCGVDKANEKIIPYVIPPEEEVYPGKPLYVNTTCSECPANCGMQVRVNEKVYNLERTLLPTKLEGIKGHPINNGALCSRGQAGLFRLYHPERIIRPMLRDKSGNLRVVTWKESLQYINQQLKRGTSEGKKNIYLSGLTNGTLSELIDDFCRKKNVERHKEFELYSYINIKIANKIVYGRKEIPHYQIDKVDYLLTIGADLFETFISPVNFATQFGKAKKNPEFSWYHIEPHLSLTGIQADRRIPIFPENEVVFLSFLIQEVVKRKKSFNNLPESILSLIPETTLPEVSSSTGIPENSLKKIINALTGSKTPLVISGGVSIAQKIGIEVAVLTAILQWILTKENTALDFSHSFQMENVGSMLDIETLGKQLEADQVSTLFISRTDPVSSLPANINIGDKIKKAQLSICMSDVLTATASTCDLILPLSHSLESWGDASPYRGLINFYQPAIQKQYDSFSEGDILLAIMELEEKGSETVSYQKYLYNKWESVYGAAELELILEIGFKEEPVPKIKVNLDRKAIVEFLQKGNFQSVKKENVLYVTPSIRSFDGRSKDLSLLKEIPDPLSTITYGEWVAIPEKTAESLSLKDGDEVEMKTEELSLRLAVKIFKLLPENVFSIYRDFVSSSLVDMDKRTGEFVWNFCNLSIKKTGRKIPLAVLAGSMKEEGRGLLPHYENSGHGHNHEQKRWYPEHKHKDYRWGMTVDLDSCIGCNSCVAACYVENNIPIVGKEEHLKGREMSWLRLQPYLDNNTIEFVPMLCQHCDNAPCEPVCPVYAAYHNPEGLNVQVYNRCVGTRYCANNCPYKVRRFNWFDHRLPEPLDKMYNPDISVRDRGIMEKCTFCIQRIRAAKDRAKDESRKVQDGEILPACAQTCPTQAVTFGNLEDKNSKVYQLVHSDPAYRVLEELGTEPAVYYLRKKENFHEV